MSTVSLRGTLIPPSAGDGSSHTTSWQWKGMWAFGSSLATVPAQSQQAFVYSFQKATHPSEVLVPGIVVEEQGENPEQQQQEEAEATPQAAEANGEEMQNQGTAPDSAPDAESSASNDKADQASAEDTMTKDAKTDNDQQEPATGASTSGANTIETATNSNEASLTTDIQQTAPTTTTPPTFATVPEGHPEFTEACQTYPQLPCPLSGQWKGHFQNVAGTRPRDKIQKVQETFYLFFNGTPGPEVKYFFDETPLPPTVHKESLVLVRGMGTNPFGTFELIGYLDLTSSVLEIQRQYVLLPPPRNHKRTSTATTTSSPTNSHNKKSPSSSNMTTRHKKSYFTRKRQPSWKLKSLEEQDEAAAKRQRTKKGGKGLGAGEDGAVIFPGATPSPDATAAVFGMSAVSSSGIMPDASTLPGTAITGIPPIPVPGAIPSTTIMPPPSTATTATTTISPGGIPTMIHPTTHLSILTDGSSLAISTTATTGVSAGKAKRSKTPRKRTASVSSNKSTVSAATTAASSVGAGAASGSSPFLKLPPVGEPKKARWRAAHFLYYQRHEPDEVFPEISNGPNKSGGGTTSAASSTTSSTGTPNPRYVVYEGELVNAQREGRGICLYSNNMLYEGQWRRNKEHGRGQLWTADRKRLIYDGEWERGRMQGKGTYYYGPGSTTTSSNSKNNHTPNLRPSGGSRYIGEFKENMRNGVGQYILPDGSVYDGMWSQGKMNGRGVFTWPDYSVYDGEWKDGERHGQGLLKASDGFVYDGMWVRNAMEGRGVATYPNGQTYEGLFSNGRREGRGTMHFTNGAVYEGRFRDDAVDGQGTMKMSRSLIVPSHKNKRDSVDGSGDDDDVDAGNDDSSLDDQQDGSNDIKHDFMIPISFQSDMTHIHAKAGFTAIGD